MVSWQCDMFLALLSIGKIDDKVFFIACVVYNEDIVVHGRYVPLVNYKEKTLEKIILLILQIIGVIVEIIRIVIETW